MSLLQELFAERRRKCEEDQARKELAKTEEREAEKAVLRAKAKARKQAMLADPKSPQAIQAKYAEEVRQSLAKDKRDKEIILRRIEDDKIARREREQQRKAIQQDKLLAEAEGVGDVCVDFNVGDRGSGQDSGSEHD